MPGQPGFPGLRDAMKKKVTRRELFLFEMDPVPQMRVFPACGLAHPQRQAPHSNTCKTIRPRGWQPDQPAPHQFLHQK